MLIVDSVSKKTTLVEEHCSEQDLAENVQQALNNFIISLFFAESLLSPETYLLDKRKYV